MRDAGTPKFTLTWSLSSCSFGSLYLQPLQQPELHKTQRKKCRTPGHGRIFWSFPEILFCAPSIDCIGSDNRQHTTALTCQSAEPPSSISHPRNHVRHQLAGPPAPAGLPGRLGWHICHILNSLPEEESSYVGPVLLRIHPTRLLTVSSPVQSANLAPWFGPHLQRNIYLSLLHMEPEEGTEKAPKIPDSVIRAALLRRAVEDINRIIQIRTAKAACSSLLQRGSVGDDLWQRFQRAEKEMEDELRDVVMEVCFRPSLPFCLEHSLIDMTRPMLLYQDGAKSSSSPPTKLPPTRSSATDSTRSRPKPTRRRNGGRSAVPPFRSSS